MSDAEQENKDVAKQAKEALKLLSTWNEGNKPMPKTFRVLLDALLLGWVDSFIDETLEKDIVAALLALGGLDDKEEGQLEEALRYCAKVHLHYQPKKLLRILASTTEGHNETVAHWAFKMLTRTSDVDHLRFAARCLLACGEGNDNPLDLEEAAVFHIESAAKILKRAENVRFDDVRGGPSKPMGRNAEVALRTATLVEYIWITSNMGEKSKKDSEAYAYEWLDAAHNQLVKQLGTRTGRDFEVKLTVRTYPHVENWYARVDKLKPIQITSRTV